MNPLKTYIETLYYLQKNNILFTVTGTFALYLQERKFSEKYSIKDCDIFIANTKENLSAFVLSMKAQQWEVWIWEEPVLMKNLMEQAKGKKYIRCTKHSLIVDATYEHEAAVFGDPKNDTILVEGLSVIRATKILSGKKHRGTERDLLAITCFKNLSRF